MQSVGNRLDYASRLWEANTPFFGALYRNVILFLGFFGLSALYLAPAKFQFGPIPINVFFPSILVVIGCMSIVGKRVLTVTPMDYLFGAWFCLALLSHIFANEFLFRSLRIDDLYTNIEFILALALIYRAFFALTIVDLKLATRTFIATSLFTCGGIVTLGMMQRYGPGKSVAIKLGMMLSKVPQQVAQGVQLNRPTAIYDNPNMLAYVCCILAVFALGWGLRDVKGLKPGKTAAFMVLLGLAIFGTLTCQSRSNLGLLFFTPIVAGVIIRLYAKDGRNTIVVAVMAAIAMFGAVSYISLSKSTYLLSLSKQRLSQDASFQMRKQELQKVGDIGSDIAPLGSGQSAANLQNGGMVGGYSYYRLPNVDSEWANIYSAFGVWGPLLLVFLYVLNGQMVRDVWKEAEPEGRMMAIMAAFLLAFNLVLTISAVRVAKYDTGLFTFQILGVLAAWRTARLEKGLLKRGLPLGGRVAKTPAEA